MYILGIDIGTQGVRGIVTDERGSICAEASASFARVSTTDVPDHKEQNPQDWAQAVTAVIAQCAKDTPGNIDAVSLDATSGTVLAIDADNKPITAGIMYNDARAKAQAKRVHEAAGEHERAHGYVFNASYALPKILWVKENMPEIYERAHKFIHQSDYIYGMLTGNYNVSDYSNALKTGYDLINERWPDFISGLGIDVALLPEVIAPTGRIGNVSAEAAAKTGLSADTVLFAGATDGYASSLAAGLCVPGEWATVIGTTMVLKGITKKLVLDEAGRIYSHKHPQGWWLPGGASNVGGLCLNEMFGKQNFDEYNKTVASYTPTGDIAYPLTIDGERFPFVNPAARGFYAGDTTDEKKRYAAVMEGVGYTERLSYELLQKLGCEVGGYILTSGGACKSAEWLQIRADILQRALRVPASTDAAMGSAMMAAAGAQSIPLSEAVSAMVKIDKEVLPDTSKKARYEELYARFKQELSERGYLNEHI